MSFFPCAHAGHTPWQQAARQVAVQLSAQISMQQLAQPPQLALVYVSQAYAPHVQGIMSVLVAALPHVRHWVGCAVPSVLAADTHYGAAGALAVMLPCLAESDYWLFSSGTPWPDAQTWSRCGQVLVHGDASSASTSAALESLQLHMLPARLTGGMGQRLPHPAQWAWKTSGALHAMPASIGGAGVQLGGFSGLALAQAVGCMSISMQGYQTQGPALQITRAEGNVVLELDGLPALRRWQSSQASISHAPAGSHFVQLSAPEAYAFEAAGPQVYGVRALDVGRSALVLDGPVRVGHWMRHCCSDETMARQEVRRACAEVWETLTCEATTLAATPEPADRQSPSARRGIAGAVYIRSQHRQAMQAGAHEDAELQLIRHALGPIPLLGFTSSYEIEAGGLQQLSAQLLVFTQPMTALT